MSVVSPDNLAVTDSDACVITQYPDFYGRIQALTPYAEAAHEAKALLVVSADPVALAMFKSPGDYGADIVVGRGPDRRFIYDLRRTPMSGSLPPRPGTCDRCPGASSARPPTTVAERAMC